MASVGLTELTTHLNQLLNISAFTDYCPNGLQVAGRPTISKLITGVTANQALIDQAIEQQADAILVHHGFFWKGEAAEIVGIKKQRLAALLAHDISLLAYHLPLDVHAEYGNNAQLAKILGLTAQRTVKVDGIHDLLWFGQLAKPTSPQDFIQQLNSLLQQKPLHIVGDAYYAKPIHHVAWCTGAAQRYVEHVLNEPIDAYITGEVSESIVHTVRESPLHFFAAGHHATERYGVQALGHYLQEKFGIIHQYVDISSPV
ncbi:MAG: Nif3-like dinuclear metal center hexameric protein [Gammaproteobacteria bacterium]